MPVITPFLKVSRMKNIFVHFASKLAEVSQKCPFCKYYPIFTMHLMKNKERGPVISQIWGKKNHQLQIGQFWGKIVKSNYSLLPHLFSILNIS